MSTKTKVSVLDRAMHIAHTWINDLARELDTEDREFAYRVLGRGCTPCVIGFLWRPAPTLRLSCPDLIRGVFYAGWNPNAVPEKYDAEEYLVRFRREANVSLHDVGKAVAATTAALSRYTVEAP